MTKETLRVTCAIIIENDNILCCQRLANKTMGLKWEFPGGKIEEGESEEESIVREIKEELNLDISISKKLKSFKTELENVIIELIPFICTIINGQVINREHEKVLWLKRKELSKLDWAKPDLPIVEFIKSIN